MADYTKSYEYLTKSKNILDTAEFSNVLMVRYHRTWANYYYCQKMWTNSLEEIDNALLFSDNRQPLVRSTILKSKAKYNYASGDYKTALECYKTSFSYSDSLYMDFLQKQDKAIKDNYRWEMGLVKKARNENIINIISIVFVSIVFLFIAFLVIKLYLNNKALKKASENARIAAQKASEAAVLKDNYLKNVRQEILSPLDEISTMLENNDMSKVCELSSSLESMLDKILDLTYLESGQMKFDIKEYFSSKAICSRSRIKSTSFSSNLSEALTNYL